MTVAVPVGHGFSAVVDERDYELVSRHTWRLQKARGNVLYARTHMPRPEGGYSTVGMHVLINQTPSGFHTDHKDGDGLNNTRSNLRTATRSQNMHNRRPNCRGTSAFKGVHLIKNGSWRASIRVDGCLHNLGLFDSERAAADAYDAAALRYFGEFARINGGLK